MATADVSLSLDSSARITRAPRWAAVLVCAAALAAYHNSFHGPFVFDDASSIVTNPTIHRLWPLHETLAGPVNNVTAQGRPLLNLSLAIDYALGGTAVEIYHVTNLLIHALAGLALFGVVRRTLLLRSGAARARDIGSGANATWVALTVAVLWLVHPLQTESVTYIIQRAESLVGLLYLLTFYCFVRGVEGAGCDGRVRRSRWMGFSVLTCVAGMATKEVMATAPLMVLFFDRTFVSGTFLQALRRRRGFYIALASTWLLLAWLIARTGGNRGGSVGFGVGVAWWDYWLTQFAAVAHYLWLSFWPHPLVFEYGSFWIRDWTEIAVQIAIVLGLLGATIVALRKRSAWGFLGAWFFGILAPTSLAPGTTQMIVEHRMYLPLAAVITLVVVAVWNAWHGSGWKPFALVFAGAATAWGALTVQRNHDYRSDIALWRDTVMKRPANPLAHFMLAGAHEREGETEAAVAGYERTLRLKSDFSIGHENFGQLLLRLGRRADAIVHFEAALQLQPEYPDAHANLGNAYLAVGRVEDAVRQLAKAVQLTPESAIVRYNLGNALAAAGQLTEAVVAYQTALKLQPGMAEAHFNLANVLMDLRERDSAIAHYRNAVKMRPDYATAHYNLANALAASGRQPEAVAHYEAALRARAEYPEAHHNLGSALFELGRLTEAAGHYEETLRLQPGFPNARENLERVRARMKADRGAR